jgi:hypothetical protein
MDQIQKQIDDLARMQKDELAKIMNESKRVDDTKKHMAEKVSDLIRTVEAIRLLVEPGVPRVFPPRKRPRVVHLSNQDQYSPNENLQYGGNFFVCSNFQECFGQLL